MDESSESVRIEANDGSKVPMKRSLSDATKDSPPSRHGAPWEREEIEKLVDGIQCGLTLQALAERHQRTRNGIAGITTRLIPSALRPKSRSHAVTILAQHLLEHDDDEPKRLVSEYLRMRATHRASKAPWPPNQARQTQPPPSACPPEERTAVSEEAYHTGAINAAMLVSAAISTMPEGRSADILRMRHGVDEHSFTLAEIGKKYNITGERVRQIEEKSLRKLAWRARIEGTPGATLKGIVEPLSQDENALAAWLLEVSRVSFESRPEIAARFILRTAGYTKERSLKVLRLLNGIECPRIAKTGNHTSAAPPSETVRPEVTHWLRYTDWPEEIEPPPPAATLTTQRAIGESEISGSFHSEKLGRPVAYESHLELGVITELERSEHIAYYQEQPAKIPYTFEGRSRNYYPDLFAATIDGRGILIEVKPTGNMALDINLAKAEAGRAWAHARGWGWLIVSDRCTFREIQQHILTDRKRHFFDLEMQKQGFLTWREIFRFRSKHDLTKIDFIAYVIQSGIRLDQAYRATVCDAVADTSSR